MSITPVRTAYNGVVIHGKGRYGLQCLTNLDLLPRKGAVIVSAPLKIKNGSGSPLHVFALIEVTP